MMFSVKTVNNAAGGGGELTSAPVVVPVLAQYNIEPDALYWAMPAPGQTLQGLRRGCLYSLIRDGEVASFVVRRKNRSRGRRLIVAESLANYLRRLRDEQNLTRNEGEEAK